MADHAQDGLLREIDEELRQEHYAKLWKRYGSYVIAATVVLVVGVAGFQIWRAQDTKARRANSEAYTLAERLIRQGKPDEAAAAFAALAADARSGYALLARFQEAAVRANQDKAQEAAAIYREIAADTSLPQIYRNEAIVLGAFQELDTADPAALEARVTPLSGGDSPWRHSVREITGLIALRSGDRDKARETFRALSQDATAPAAIRNRAGEMLAILGS